jgi:hypothetical protein
MFLSNRGSPPKQTCTRRHTGGSTHAESDDSQPTTGDECQPTEATVMRRKSIVITQPEMTDSPSQQTPPPTPPRLTDREHSRMNTAGPHGWPPPWQAERRRSMKTRGLAGRRRRLPHRASTEQSPTTRGGARRPSPGGGRLTPDTWCRGGHPGGASRPPGSCRGSGRALEEPAGQERRAKGPRGDREWRGAEQQRPGGKGGWTKPQRQGRGGPKDD